MKKLLLLFTITLFFVITGCSHKYIPGITKNFYEVINESEVINENKKTTLFINSITLSDQKDLSEIYQELSYDELANALHDWLNPGDEDGEGGTSTESTTTSTTGTNSTAASTTSTTENTTVSDTTEAFDELFNK